MDLLTVLKCKCWLPLVAVGLTEFDVCRCMCFMSLCKSALLFTTTDSNGCTSFEIVRQFETSDNTPSLYTVTAAATATGTATVALALAAAGAIVCMAVHMRHLFYYSGYVHILFRMVFAFFLWLNVLQHSATH